MAEHDATGSLTAKPEPVAIFGCALRQVRLHGAIIAAEAALMFGSIATASAWDFDPQRSCVNIAFCADLPGGNWQWSAAPSGPDGLPQAYDAPGNWISTVGADYPNDPGAVVVFSAGISAELDETPVQAFSWTLSVAYGATFVTGGTVAFPKGGGIFSSSDAIILNQIRITGAGGLYLFPVAFTGQEVAFWPSAPPRYALRVEGTRNDYTGPTEITGATLYASGGGAIGDQSAVTIDDTPAIVGVTRDQTGVLDVVRQAETIGSLAGIGEVNLGGDLTTGGNGLTTTYAGLISGAGALIKAGTGTFTLTGANSYSGGTFVSGGTLVGNVGSIPGTISNSATAVFDQAADATFSGAVVALGGVSGQMVKQGAGTLTLSGTSALPWSVQAGRLVSASDRFTGNLALSAGTSFTFDQTYNGTYAGEITGAGDVTFSGGGLVSLTGESTQHTGTSTVSGMLSVNGTHSGSIAVVSGGTLQGSGTVGDTAIGRGGTLAPGNSIGTLRVRQSLAMAPGSTYLAEIEPGGTADLVKVTGTAILDGAAVEVRRFPHGDTTKARSFRNGQTYTILEAGAINGAFQPTAHTASAFLDATVATDAREAKLTLRPKTAGPLFATVAATANQQRTATALDALGQETGSASLELYNSILFRGAEEARAAFDGLSGEIHASAKTVLFQDSALVRDAIGDRLALIGSDGSPSKAAGGDAAALGTSGFEAWFSGYGAWGATQGDANAAGFDQRTGGALVGLDGLLADRVRIGLMAGYGSGSTDLDARRSSASTDSTHLGIYAGTMLGAFDLKGGASYSWNEVDTSRAVSVAGFSDSLSATYDIGTGQVFGEAAVPLRWSGMTVSPFADLAYVDLESDGFGERGGAAALSSPGGNEAIVVSTLGTRLGADITVGNVSIRATGLLGWRHAEGDIAPAASLRFADGEGFGSASAPLDQDAAVVDIGLAVALAPQADLSVRYGGQFGRDTLRNGFTAKLAIAF